SALTNAGLLLADSTLPLSIGAISNSGVVQVQGNLAMLTGGTITNSGTVKGYGHIANSIINTGVLRAEGGELDLASASTSNTAGGVIQVASGNTLFFQQGLSSNAGQIVLTGGSFDNGAHGLTNSGNIIGNGSLRASAVTNNATMSFGGSSTDLIATLTNNNLS